MLYDNYCKEPFKTVLHSTTNRSTDWEVPKRHPWMLEIWGLSKLIRLLKVILRSNYDKTLERTLPGTIWVTIQASSPTLDSPRA